jgi:hypothetical protein
LTQDLPSFVEIGNFWIISERQVILSGTLGWQIFKMEFDAVLPTADPDFMHFPGLWWFNAL